jgi:hypothetical protein
MGLSNTPSLESNTTVSENITLQEAREKIHNETRALLSQLRAEVELTTATATTLPSNEIQSSLVTDTQVSADTSAMQQETTVDATSTL